MESLSVQTRNLWRDYSTDSFRGDVFTLTVTSGHYLLAALSVFVTLVGPSTWAIVSFVLHQIKAKNTATEDGLYFQSQVLLRHPGSPGVALKDVFLMWWAWRPRKSSKRVPRLVGRLSTILLPALVIFIGFSVAGIFVSKVARVAYESSNILLASVACGAWGFDLSTTTGIAAAQEKNTNDTKNARAYAQNCYEQALKTGICSLYPVSSIPITSSDVPCPFDPDPSAENACLYGQNQALLLDTGLLNSNEIFGINTGPGNHLLVRKVVTCSPFHAENYVNQSLSLNGGYTIWNFDLGRLSGSFSNYTYSYNTYGREAGIAFTLYSVSTVNDTWHPVRALTTLDADLSAHFLSQNSVIYEEKVEDIWFSATRTDGEAAGYYGPDEYTNVLVCAEQHQIVNPVSGAPSSLGTVIDLDKQYRNLGLSAVQEAIAQRFILSFTLSSIFNTVSNLGPSSLLATDHILELVGTTLPDDQWKREVRGWFETSLARIQWFVIEYNHNTADLGGQGFITLPSKSSQDPVDQAQIELCSAQRVRNTDNYQTFSLWGVVITFSVGGALLLASICLEWCVKRCRRIRRGHSHRAIARISDGNYQYVRKTLRVINSAEQNIDEETAWDEVMDAIPVAKPGVRFKIPQWKDGDYHYGIVPQRDPDRAHEHPGGDHEMHLLRDSMERLRPDNENLRRDEAASSEISIFGSLRQDDTPHGGEIR